MNNLVKFSDHLKLGVNFYQVVISIKISNLLICFCSFDLFCPIYEKLFYQKFVTHVCSDLFYRRRIKKIISRSARKVKNVADRGRSRTNFYFFKCCGVI